MDPPHVFGDDYYFINGLISSCSRLCIYAWFCQINFSLWEELCGIISAKIFSHDYYFPAIKRANIWLRYVFDVDQLINTFSHALLSVL